MSKNEELVNMKPETYILSMMENKEFDARSKVSKYVTVLQNTHDAYKIRDLEKKRDGVISKIEDALQAGEEPELTQGEILIAKAWLIKGENIMGRSDLDATKVKYAQETKQAQPTPKKRTKTAGCTIGDLVIKEKKLSETQLNKILSEPEDPTIDMEEIAEKAKKPSKAKKQTVSQSQRSNQKVAVINQAQSIPIKLPETQYEIIQTFWNRGKAEHKGQEILFDKDDEEFMNVNVRHPSWKAMIPIQMKVIGEIPEGIIAIPMREEFIKQKEEHDKKMIERQKQREEEDRRQQEAEKRQLEEELKIAFEAVAIKVGGKVSFVTDQDGYSDKLLLISGSHKDDMLDHEASRGTWLVVPKKALDNRKIVVKPLKQIKKYNPEQESKIVLEKFGMKTGDEVVEGYVSYIRDELKISSKFIDGKRRVIVPKQHHDMILTQRGPWAFRYSHTQAGTNNIVLEPIEYMGIEQIKKLPGGVDDGTGKCK